MKKNLRQILGLPYSQLEKFNELTKILKKRKQPSKLKYRNWPENWKKIYFKSYPRLTYIKLPLPGKNKADFFQTLKNRQSRRNFCSTPLTQEEISTLLYYSAGLRQTHFFSSNRRFYPSAGARYPLETYLITINSEIPKGIYHYNVRSHILEKFSSFNKLSLDCYFDQSFIKRSGAIIILSAVFKRTVIKYGQRSYRYIFIEAGHLGQNLSLIATSLGLKSCAIGSFFDEEINRLFDIDGVKESSIYCFALGK